VARRARADDDDFLERRLVFRRERRTPQHETKPDAPTPRIDRIAGRKTFTMTLTPGSYCADRVYGRGKRPVNAEFGCSTRTGLDAVLAGKAFLVDCERHAVETIHVKQGLAHFHAAECRHVGTVRLRTSSSPFRIFILT
jgi:hypothetical protein